MRKTENILIFLFSLFYLLGCEQEKVDSNFEQNVFMEVLPKIVDSMFVDIRPFPSPPKEIRNEKDRKLKMKKWKEYGPWKFGGLPGMILKVVAKSDRETYKMECYSIEKHKQDTESDFTNYLKKNKKKKFQTWDEFVEDFNSFLDRYIKGLKSEVEADGDSGFTLNFSVDNHLEIFSEKVQTDGILLEF